MRSDGEVNDAQARGPVTQTFAVSERGSFQTVKVHLECLAVPCDDGFGPDDDQRGSQVWRDARQPNLYKTVRRISALQGLPITTSRSSGDA